MRLNREIKFRGLTSSGEWVYGYYVYSAKLERYLIFTEGDMIEKVIPQTVGQSTGRRYFPDTDVFEGDIIEWSGEQGIEDGMGVVVWDAENLCFAVRFNTHYQNYESPFYLSYLRQFQIVGNIHENSNLID